jgi:hypothetical protein
MVNTKTTWARRTQQNRLGDLLVGLTLVAVGGCLMVQNRLGTVDLGLLRFWPVSLILAGLPLVLRPTDDTNQIWGISLVGAGVFFQLHSLGVIPWTLDQTWPLLLILGGALLLVRSRRSNAAPSQETPGSDPSENGR